MLTIDDLRFDKDGLIPAVVQDASSGKVLTVAYMNRESLEISMRRDVRVSGAARVKSFGERAKIQATFNISLK